MKDEKVLLLSIGTGDITCQRETLFNPIKKSIAEGKWSKIVFLTSQISNEFAEILAKEIEHYTIEIKPLENQGAENNADECYAQFNKVISSLLEEGYLKENIVVDFTRGTKSMSAALVLAAVRHDILILRYITGVRDERGMVKPGTEIISEFLTTNATGQKLLDMAYNYFYKGDFSACIEMLPKESELKASHWSDGLLNTFKFSLKLASFYSKWDRLDYKAATSEINDLNTLTCDDGRWNKFCVTDDMKQWVTLLAEDLPSKHSDMAYRLRFLAADILANGERRIRDYHFEDAVIRAYRVLELIGQFRLFDKGMDSGRLDPTNTYVIKKCEELRKNKSNSFGNNTDGTYTAGRYQVAQLLKCMKDPIASKLIALGDEGIINQKTRNKSVLIHGFETATPSDIAPIKEIYKKLSDLLIEEGGSEAKQRLKIARSLDFSNTN